MAPELAEFETNRRISPEELRAWNTELGKASPEQRVEWAAKEFGSGLITTSSFGIQSAVMLHLSQTVVPGIPVVFIDTGYLFPETYRFVDSLTSMLDLNLKVYRPQWSPAWQETRYGKLWEQGLAGIEKYNLINKVEPMQRALEELQVVAWMAGLRREQAQSREGLDVVTLQDGRVKIHPIIEWSNRQVYEYLKTNQLPYHPLWEEGYVSVGDRHTSRKWEEGMTEEETRFFGLKRECGLHESQTDFSI